MNTCTKHCRPEHDEHSEECIKADPIPETWKPRDFVLAIHGAMLGRSVEGAERCLNEYADRKYAGLVKAAGKLQMNCGHAQWCPAREGNEFCGCGLRSLAKALRQVEGE